MSILIFPATFEQMIGDSSTLSYMNKQYSLAWQNKIYWAYMTNDLFGIHNSIWKTMTWEYIAYGIGIILFITLPLGFVFRHESWLKNALICSKNKVVDICKRIRKCSYTIIVMISTVIFVILIAAAKTSVGRWDVVVQDIYL